MINFFTLFNSWRRIRELEAERERLLQLISNPELTGITIGCETADLTMDMTGSAPALLAGMFLGFIQQHKATAPNFLEMHAMTSEGPIVVTVTQPHGATPGILLDQAKKRIKELEAQLAAGTVELPLDVTP